MQMTVHIKYKYKITGTPFLCHQELYIVYNAESDHVNRRGVVRKGSSYTSIEGPMC